MDRSQDSIEKAKAANRSEYIPAFSHDFLTPMYDTIMRWAARESTLKSQLVKQASIEKGHRVLDVGCGTATLTILLKKAQPEAEVIGLDGDPRIIELARLKAKKASADIALDYGMAFDLPYPDNSFDRVVASLVFHHLTREDRVRTFREIFRVLRPLGELHIVELGKPQNALMYLPSVIIRHFEEAADFVEGLLPETLRSVGFIQVNETAKYMTGVGTISLYKAQKPEHSVLT